MEKRYANYNNCSPRTREYFEKLDSEYNSVVDYYNLISNQDLLLIDKEILTAVRRYAKANICEENQENIAAYMKVFKNDLTNGVNREQETVESQISPLIIRLIDFDKED